jgi:hypothetical protein
MKKYTVLFLVSLLLFACKKDFLDTRPAKSLLVPATLADMRALLDNNMVFNNSPALSAEADGDLYTTEAGFDAFLTAPERPNYTWAKDIFGSEVAGDWNAPYEQLFYANVVLEGLGKLPASAERGELEGTALFHRAYATYNLAQVFAPVYRKATADSDPGVPLKLSADVSVRPARASLAATYAQVIADLSRARALLPAKTAAVSRPSVAAAQALFARIYLSMGDDARAGAYADSCLRRGGALIDYNTLDSLLTRPLPQAAAGENPEVIFYSISLAYTYGGSYSAVYVDSLLYSSYARDDLRKVMFFRELEPGAFKFRGTYTGILYIFSGLATDELYLIRAECAARAGHTAAALADLNALLEKRWVQGRFVPYTAGSAAGALRLVLSERRKELLLRGLRWGDLKRLNLDPAFRLTLHRRIGGQDYTLEPGSPRYVYPIPAQELKLNPNIVQNER